MQPRLLLALAAALSVCACGSTSSSSLPAPPKGDEPATSISLEDPPDGGSCNELPVTDETVPSSTDYLGVRPDASGGAITEGVYKLTWESWYGMLPPTEPPSPINYLAIRGNVLLTRDDAGSANDSFTIAGTSLHVRPGCRAGSPAIAGAVYIPYTATANELTLYSTESPVLRRYERVP